MTATPQAISRILKGAGLQVSRQFKGRICYMSTEGFRVSYDWQKNVTINYGARTGSFTGRCNFDPAEQYAKAIEVLQAKGYTTRDGEFGTIVEKVAA